MDTPNFKDILEKLSVLKNSSLLSPIIIAVVGLLLFIPAQIMNGRLKKKVETESIRGFGSQVRALKSGVVPSKQHEVEAKLQQGHANDANEIARLALQSTQRQLLSYEVFPEPKGTSQFIFNRFGQGFRSAVDGLLVRLNARNCPTDAELNRATQGSLTGSRTGGGYSSARSYSGSSGFPYGSGGSRKTNEISSTIVDGICRERAKSASVYGSPLDLGGYEFWGDYKYVGPDEAVGDCWYYQLAYWVIEDVVDTVEAMNSGSSSVFTSPVKRLLGVHFSPDKMSYMKSSRSGIYGGRIGRSTRTSTSSTSSDDKASYVLSMEDGLVEPCTGRISNEDVDIIHFNVVVVVGTKAVFPYMQQLCSAKEHNFKGFTGREREQSFKHNQISILQDRIVPIDREDQEHELYRYGEDAVVVLDLVCEYIFNKKGYDAIKPESVKTTLAGEDTTKTSTNYNYR